ncbi:MAG: N-acetylmuramoyl-L-alanine amidase [Promicromonosporaceae bacterium]|nr:N-acetylmuramoyl-L-alanine amidase [Promicromonosporaceae bacterium]
MNERPRQAGTIPETTIAAFCGAVALVVLAIAALGSWLAPAASATPSDVPDVRPHVISRAEWGAAEPRCASDTHTHLIHAVVHHTSGQTQFGGQDEVHARLRSIQQDHQTSQRFCDIGYNFLIDPAGNIFEGAAGSLTSPVIGAHARGFNTGSVSVALLGDFDHTEPTPAALQAAGEIIGYRPGRHGVDPTAEITRYPAATNLTWPVEQQMAIPAIVGHDTLGVTECPGHHLLAALPVIRQHAATTTAEVQAAGLFGGGDPGFTGPAADGFPAVLTAWVTPWRAAGVALALAAVFVIAIVVKVRLRLRRDGRPRLG